MSDTLVPGSTLEPEVTAPQADSPAGSDTPDTAPEIADPAAEPPAEQGDAAEAPTANDPDKTASKNRVPARDRIAEVVAERNAERERVKAANEAAEFWRKQALGLNAPAEAAEGPKPAPKLADFEYDHDKWAEAHANWASSEIDRRSAAAVDARLRASEQQTQQRSVVERFTTREAEFAKAVPDYHAVTGDPRLAEFATPTIAEVMAVSDHGPAIGYHLAKHPEELARISQLTPIQQAAALGRIEAQVASVKTPTPAKKTVTTTRAPAPLSPVGSATPSKKLEDMDIHEYMANRTWGRPT